MNPDENEQMRAREAVRFLGWSDTSAAAGRRLRRRALQAEREAGRTLFPRSENGHIIYTPRTLQRHLPDLMHARYVVTSRTVRDRLDQVNETLQGALDQKIRNHPIIVQHGKHLEEHSEHIEGLTSAVERLAKAVTGRGLNGVENRTISGNSETV